MPKKQTATAPNRIAAHLIALPIFVRISLPRINSAATLDVRCTV
jgi:hypothetical protein